MTNVFVYGTLKRGFRLHGALEGSEFLGKARSRDPSFVMCDLGSYPMLFWGEQNYYVVGEMYEVDGHTLARLDHVEENGFRYQRKLFPFVLEDGRRVAAWVYIGLGDQHRWPLVKECRLPGSAYPQQEYVR